MVSTPSESIPALKVENLSKQYHGITVLQNISLTAQTGDVIALLGSSGAGKSTFLRCINLLTIPDSGNVYVSGELIQMHRKSNGTQVPASQQQVERLRKNLAMVFQNFNLWAHMTILENIIAAPIHVLKLPKAEAIARAEALLQKVGIINKRNHYPNQLSGGQQQRAAIARALAMEPQVMLFDEPTSALDPEMVGEVLNVVRNIAAEGKTMIIATHEMGFAREVASQVMFLDMGEIIEQGTPQEVFTNPKSARFRRFISSVINHESENF